jgi:hypothetical protein
MNKTTIFVLAIFASFFVISSCKKDYSCKCTGTIAGFSGDTTVYLGNMKKKEAKEQCNSYESGLNLLGSIFGASVDCKLQ